MNQTFFLHRNFESSVGQVPLSLSQADSTSKPLRAKSLQSPILQETRARITANVGNDVVKSVYAALTPELHGVTKSRLDVQASISSDSIVLILMGTDVATLRAAINSYLRLIYVATKSIRIIEK